MVGPADHSGTPMQTTRKLLDGVANQLLVVADSLPQDRAPNGPARRTVVFAGNSGRHAMYGNTRLCVPDVLAAESVRTRGGSRHGVKVHALESVLVRSRYPLECEGPTPLCVATPVGGLRLDGHGPTVGAARGSQSVGSH